MSEEWLGKMKKEGVAVEGVMEDRRGKVLILRFLRLPMGGRSMPLVGQSVSSIMALLVEAMVPGARVWPVQDDLCMRARGKEMERKVWEALEEVYRRATLRRRPVRGWSLGRRWSCWGG